MASTMTRAQLRDAAKQRADMVNASFVSDAEWNSYIQQSAYELYDLLVQCYGNDYYVATPATITTDGTNDTYSLAADFYKLLGVDLQLTSGQNAYVTLKPFDFVERNRYTLPNTLGLLGVLSLQYRMRGDKLWFIPLPASGQTVRYFYIPRLTEFASDSSTLDGISGWTEYVIVDAAIKAKDKEESDVQVLMAQKQGLVQRIQSAAQNRDAGSPAKVADTQGLGFGPYGGGYGYGGGWTP